MVGKLLQCRAHLIFACAPTKMLMEQVRYWTRTDPKIGRNGKPIVATHVVAAADRRWMSAGNRFAALPYELTVSLLMLPSSPVFRCR